MPKLIRSKNDFYEFVEQTSAFKVVLITKESIPPHEAACQRLQQLADIFSVNYDIQFGVVDALMIPSLIPELEITCCPTFVMYSRQNAVQAFEGLVALTKLQTEMLEIIYANSAVARVTKSIPRNFQLRNRPLPRLFKLLPTVLIFQKIPVLPEDNRSSLG